MDLISKEQGEFLVGLARESIEKYLKEGEKPEPPRKEDEELNENRGVFVTLKKDGHLRGCIGRPLPDQSLLNGIIESAISAATRDPRFPSLQLEELPDVTLEVSVLTVPVEIDADEPKEYVKAIEVGKHGLIAKGGGREGLLLPQVPVEQDWDEEEFISQTCVKAGLPPDSWKEGNTKIEKFSAQVFKEESPEGSIIEESFSN